MLIPMTITSYTGKARTHIVEVGDLESLATTIYKIREYFLEHAPEIYGPVYSIVLMQKPIIEIGLLNSIYPFVANISTTDKSLFVETREIKNLSKLFRGTGEVPEAGLPATMLLDVYPGLETDIERGVFPTYTLVVTTKLDKKKVGKLVTGCISLGLAIAKPFIPLPWN